MEGVLRYYELVDAGDIEAPLALFSPDIRYNREGTGSIIGIDALRRFYVHERIIERGTHADFDIRPDGDAIRVAGRFTGTLKDGSSVNVRFEDNFHFGEDGSIVHRETTFPRGERQI